MSKTEPGELREQNELREAVLEACKRSREASMSLVSLSGQRRCELLEHLAQRVWQASASIVAANDKDLAKARENGMSEGLQDRLTLTPERVQALCDALHHIATLPDPLGEVIAGRRLANGLEIRQERVPLGVVAMIYEARPNVTIDAIALTLKTGNSVILRGGSAAINTNRELVALARQTLREEGLPEACVTSIDEYGREGAKVVMQARGLVDVLIPRGGAGLIQTCVREAQVPVIETGVGNCHVYVDRTADLQKAIQIVVNAKTHRVGVCNAAETLLIDKRDANRLVPPLLAALGEKGVKLHTDVYTRETLYDQAELPAFDLIKLVSDATEQDYATEYLALEMAVACVDGVEGAIEHIRTYSTGHTEAIVAEDYETIRKFTREVDSAAVMVNASTRFTDGEQFGLGAEIGISTQKLHARGPFALDALTTGKWLVFGEGHTRK